MAPLSRSLATLAAAAALAALPGAASAAEAPERNLLRPGVGLGGLRLGATEQQVRAAWGTRFGVCRDCRRQTWYFNRRPFEPQGAGVEFRDGRAAALFTLWAPEGWATPEGLAIGDPVARITQVYGPLTRRECGLYYALVQPRARAVTAYYVVDERLWGFGLNAAAIPVCR